MSSRSRRTSQFQKLVKNESAWQSAVGRAVVKTEVRWHQMWPMRADPMNIVMRNGKGRMTTDKTMMLALGIAPYNDCVDLEAQPSIEYVTVSTRPSRA